MTNKTTDIAVGAEEVQMIECHDCGKVFADETATLRASRGDGLYVCHKCWSKPGRAEYRTHWFSKSLQYRAAKIKPPRPRKPLPGQTDLGLDFTGVVEKGSQ